MSSAAKDSQDRQGLPALEAAVTRTIDELRTARAQATEAALRSVQLEALLGSFEAGSESPSRMKERLILLEEENRDLRARLEQGRETVERLLARFRFLEDQK